MRIMLSLGLEVLIELVVITISSMIAIALCIHGGRYLLYSCRKGLSSVSELLTYASSRCAG